MGPAEEAIRGMLASLAAAWERGDGDGFASVFAEDADFTSLRGDRTHGRAAIAAAHDRLFSTIYRGTRIEGEVEKIRYLRPDIAILDVAARLSGRGVIGPAGESAGSKMCAMAVVERGPGGWEIVAFQTMLPLGRPPELEPRPT